MQRGALLSIGFPVPAPRCSRVARLTINPAGEVRFLGTAEARRTPDPKGDQ